VIGLFGHVDGNKHEALHRPLSAIAGYISIYCTMSRGITAEMARCGTLRTLLDLAFTLVPAPELQYTFCLCPCPCPCPCPCLCLCFCPRPDSLLLLLPLPLSLPLSLRDHGAHYQDWADSDETKGERIAILPGSSRLGKY